MDWDDFATLGEDETPEDPPKVKGRIPRLVSFFASEVEMHTPMSIPVSYTHLTLPTILLV